MAAWVSSSSPSVPFRRFGDLVESISRIPPKRADETVHRTALSPDDIFGRWVSSLEFPLRPGTGAVIFRLLFPDFCRRRTYGFQEKTLSALLADILAVDLTRSVHGRHLSEWSSSSSSGCLGLEMKKVMLDSDHVNSSDVTCEYVDNLLQQLANLCPHSTDYGPSFTSTKSPKSTLYPLYSKLSPRDASIVTQIILRDLRPILYPNSAVLSSSQSLLQYNSTSRPRLSLQGSMNRWHWAMDTVYQTEAIVEKAADAVEKIPLNRPPSREVSNYLTELPQSKLFSAVDVPKTMKARSCKSSVKNFKDFVYAETKYDGQRVQIHFEKSCEEDPKIVLFSKTGRESTTDLEDIHSIIKAALNYSFDETTFQDTLYQRVRCIQEVEAPARRITRNTILEGEVVPWNEDSKIIDEFYHIFPLRKNRRFPLYQKEENKVTPRSRKPLEREDSEKSEKADHPWLHFMIVFFDILHHNGKSTLSWGYSKRRSLLEEVITCIPGFSILANRTLLDFRNDRKLAEYHFIKLFAKTISERQEGLMLKASSSPYNDKKAHNRWVKIKRDYIPGLGDCADFVIVGGGWDKTRGRELGVSPKTTTTWYAAARSEKSVDKKTEHQRKTYTILFPVSYGIDRQALDHINFEAKYQGCVKFSTYCKEPHSLGYSINLPSSKRNEPDFLLKKPMIFEIFGDRFTKLDYKSSYELRFPRICKWHSDRLPEDGITLERLEELAVESVSFDAINAQEDVSTIWSDIGIVSQEEKSPTKKKEAEWFDKLQNTDSKLHGQKRKTGLRRERPVIQSNRSDESWKKRKVTKLMPSLSSGHSSSFNSHSFTATLWERA